MITLESFTQGIQDAGDKVLRDGIAISKGGVQGKDGQAAYAKTLAWSGAGAPVTEAMTSDEAIKLAGLDWQVDVAPVNNADTGESIPNFQVVYRTDNGTALGMSRGRYTAFQNAEMFSWTDALVQDGIAQYSAAGQFQGGKKVWLLMEMTDGMTINGEEYRPHLLATTGHDMDTAFRAFTTNVRVWCLNTYTVALRGQGSSGIRISHHSKMRERLDFAQAQMMALTDSQRRMAEWLEQAANTPLKKGHYNKIEAELFGEIDEDAHPIRLRNAELFRSVYAIEREKNGETAYSVFNAATGYADHGKITQGKDNPALQAERRFLSTMSGQARDFKLAAVSALNHVTKVPMLVV